jgi:hypothetical protein
VSAWAVEGVAGSRSAPAGAGTPSGRCTDRCSRLAQIFVLWRSLTLPAGAPAPAFARPGGERSPRWHRSSAPSSVVGGRDRHSSPYGRRRGTALPEGASVTATARRSGLGESSGHCSDRRECRPPPEPNAASARSTSRSSRRSCVALSLPSAVVASFVSADGVASTGLPCRNATSVWVNAAGLDTSPHSLREVVELA